MTSSARPEPPDLHLPPPGIGLSPPEVVVFYSYKGGTGRTLSLVNLAVALAGANVDVLVVDGDLDAPGVCEFAPFHAARRAAHDRDPAPLGLLEILLEYRDVFASGKSPFDGRALLERGILDTVLDFGAPTGAPVGRLAYLPATASAPDDRAMLDRLQALDLGGAFREDFGEGMLARLREDLCTLPFDVVLIDSRTGLTEVSGAIVNDLASTVVLVTAPNQQGFRGLEAASRALGEVRRGAGRPMPRAHLLLARLPWETDESRASPGSSDSPVTDAAAFSRDVFGRLLPGAPPEPLDRLQKGLERLVSKLALHLEAPASLHAIPHDLRLALDEPIFAHLDAGSWPSGAGQHFRRFAGAVQGQLAARAIEDVRIGIETGQTGDLARLERTTRWLAGHGTGLAALVLEIALGREFQPPPPQRTAVEAVVDRLLALGQPEVPSLRWATGWLGIAGQFDLVQALLTASVALDAASGAARCSDKFLNWLLGDLCARTRFAGARSDWALPPLRAQVMALHERMLVLAEAVLAEAVLAEAVPAGLARPFAVAEREWLADLPGDIPGLSRLQARVLAILKQGR